MLGTNTNKSLLFPKLRFEKMVNLKGFGWDKEIPIYHLDWNWVDEQKRKLFDRWIETYQKGKEVWYVEPLPEPYNTLIKNFKFAIDGRYLREINRTAHEAFYEWNMNRSFDTSIREMCLDPAIAFVQVSFRLLADCLYDDTTNFYERKFPIRTIAPHLLMYKFWMHQGGRGNVRKNSLFNILDAALLNEKTSAKDTIFEIKKLYAVLSEHEKELEKSIENVMIDENKN